MRMTTIRWIVQIDSRIDEIRFYSTRLTAAEFMRRNKHICSYLFRTCCF